MEQRVADTESVFYGWWVLGALFLITAFVSGVVSFGFTTVFKPIVDEFAWSYTNVSLAASIRGLEIGLLAPVVGLLLDRLGPRKLITFGALSTGLGLILLSRIQSLPAFYGAFGLIAAGTSTCIGVVPVTVIGRWFHRRVGLATGIVLSGTATGGFLVPIVSRIIDAYGWRTATAIFGVATWLILLSLARIVRPGPGECGFAPDVELTNHGVTSSATPGAAPSITRDMTVWEALRTRAFWLLQTAFLCHILAVHAVLTHIMPFLSNIGISRSLGSLAAGAIPVLSMAGRLSFGWMGDRSDMRRLIAIGLFLTAIGLLGFSMADRFGPVILTTVLLLFGIGYGGPVPMLPAMTRFYFGPTHLGSIVGFTQGIAMVGSITGAPVAGAIFDAHGSYKAAWIAFAVANVIGAICILSAPTRTMRGTAR